MEILISYAVTNLGMLTAQSLLVVGCVVGVHQVPLYGNFGLLYFMVFLQGFCGMSCGNDTLKIFTLKVQWNTCVPATASHCLFSKFSISWVIESFKR